MSEPVEQPTVQISSVKLDEMKCYFIDNLLQNYREFLIKIENIPGHPHAKLEALRFFDTGFLWYKDSIQNMPVSPVASNGPLPQPEANSPSNEAQADSQTPKAPEAQAAVNDSLPVEAIPAA